MAIHSWSIRDCSWLVPITHVFLFLKLYCVCLKHIKHEWCLMAHEKLKCVRWQANVQKSSLLFICHWRSIRNQAQVKQPGGANRDIWIKSRRPGTSSLSHFNARPYRGLSPRARWHKEAHNAWGEDKIHRGKKSGSTLCGTWKGVGQYLEKPPCQVNVKKCHSLLLLLLDLTKKNHICKNV